MGKKHASQYANFGSLPKILLNRSLFISDTFQSKDSDFRTNKSIISFYKYLKSNLFPKNYMNYLNYLFQKTKSDY